MQKIPAAHHLEAELERQIAEFDAATRGLFKPDPQKGARLRDEFGIQEPPKAA